MRAGLAPAIRRAAILASLPVFIIAVEPNAGHASTSLPGTLSAAVTALANRSIAASVARVPDRRAWLDPELYRPAPLRRIHRVTAYCDVGLTAAGVPSGVGQCAAPADIPFGSIVYLPALDRAFVVTDRTAPRFRHNTVDIFIPDREACLQFGLNYLECEVYLPRTPPRYGSEAIRQAVLALAS